jgi:flagellar basal-body rod modification protein FlgD
LANIGRPVAFQNNYAKDIKMAKKEENLAENLNKLSGNTQNNGIKYVNRADKEKLDKDGFLKIFTSQLTNQDPFNPMDQKEMTSELAQMGTLEQMTNMNAKLDKLIGNPKLQNQMYGVSLLGKEITTAGTTIDFNGESAGVDIPINLPMNGKTVSVRITDSKGQIVKQLELENLPKGANTIHWDGKKEDESLIGKGTYNISVLGKNESMQGFTGETKVRGLVTGVKFTNGELVLNVDGSKQVFLKDIESLEEPRDNIAKKPEIN